MAAIVLTKKQEAVALTLFSWFTYRKKTWGLISRSWLKKQVEETQGVTMSLRTLDRCLAKLRDLDLLHSETRHRTDPESGEFVPEISIYWFTNELKQYVKKVFKFFKRLFSDLKDLTEYTVYDRGDKPCQHSIDPDSLKKTDPPERKEAQRPAHWTNWAFFRSEEAKA